MTTGITHLCCILLFVIFSQYNNVRHNIHCYVFKRHRQPVTVTVTTHSLVHTSTVIHTQDKMHDVEMLPSNMSQSRIWDDPHTYSNFAQWIWPGLELAFFENYSDEFTLLGSHCNISPKGIEQGEWMFTFFHSVCTPL